MSSRTPVRPGVEALERRDLMSATLVVQPTCQIHPIALRGLNPSPGFSLFGLAPGDLRTAYGVNNITFGGITGDGTGQTIAIVDAYDSPAFVDSTDPRFRTSDLAQFDRQFHLPDPPGFRKVAQDGGSQLPGTDPAGPGVNNWEMEEALDVEWAHAIAPEAGIVLVEANSPTDADLINVAVRTAANLSGVSVVSMSWGQKEDASQTNLDGIFTTPAGHQGVTFLASTGDSGAPGEYPAYSPNVVAVGGTSLTVNPIDGTYLLEFGWSGSGGGTSQFETEPPFQNGVQTTGFRTTPDVACDADPFSGVAVYDSYNNGSGSPWGEVGGTSLACPCWAGLVAIADQGIVAGGGATLDGPSQTLPALYALPAGDFHDVTFGGNGGFSAGPGYDEVTGRGSPVANRLVQDLVRPQGGGTLTAAGRTLAPTAGTPFLGTVASFTDTGPGTQASAFRATITWGDGQTSAGTVTANGSGGFDVAGSHTYAAEGRYAVSVAIVDSDGGTATATGMAHVARVGPPPARLGEVANALTHCFEYYANLVNAAYQKYLGRAPETAGLSGWVYVLQHGLSDEQLEAGFIGSPEFIADNGGLGAGWITSLYQELLGRAPSPAEVAGWLDALRGGVTPFAIAYGFAASPEREAQRITADYQQYLNRTPEPGIVAAWVSAFEHGYSNENVIAGFVGSQEYFQGHYDNVADWVYRVYQDVLGHIPDAAALQAWLRFFNGDR
jgi:hypothetical protein